MPTALSAPATSATAGAPPLRPRAAAFSAALSIAALLGLSACGPDTHGVNLINSTEQTVIAELLTIDTAGEMTPYGRAIVGPGDLFANRMEAAPRGQRSRLRLRLESQSIDEDNWVLMNLSEAKTRFYDLRLVDGRLQAFEQKRGRPTTRSAAEY